METKKSFELVLVERDAHGNPTSKTRTIASDDGNDIAAFYMKYQGKPRRKKKRQTKAAISELPKGEQADKLLKEAAKYAEKEQEKKQTP